MKYIVCDTETTGAEASDKVCEIAWVEINEALEIVDRRHSLIDPQMPIKASASGVHGLTDKDVAEAPSIEELFAVVMPGVLVGDVTMIAHNAKFDYKYFKPFVPGLAAPICTLRLAKRLWPRAEDHKLTTLVYVLGLEQGTAHRAAGDVQTCYSLLRKIAETSGLSLPQLAALSAEPFVVEIMPFGKHKGMPVKSLPSGYKSWLLNLDNLDEDLRYTLNLR